jgi:hypothetical protein
MKVQMGMEAGRLRGVSMKNLTSSLRKQLQIPTDVSGFVVVDVDPDRKDRFCSGSFTKMKPVHSDFTGTRW